MLATNLKSCSLKHDGCISDVNVMYLAQTDDLTIVVTRQMLEDAVATSPQAEKISITGPNAKDYSLYAVAVEPDYDAIKPGNWNTLTVTVLRKDIESALLDMRAEAIIGLMQGFDADQMTYADAAKALDQMIEQAERLFD